MSKTTSRDKNGLHSASSPGAGRSAEIARLAYAKAEARGFAPGHEMDDWLEAEAELSADSGEALAPEFETHRPPRAAASRGPSHR